MCIKNIRLKHILAVIVVVMANLMQEANAQDLVLQDTTIATRAVFSANSITAGPNFTISATGSVILNAKSFAVFPKFIVVQGGKLQLVSGNFPISVEMEAPIVPGGFVIHQNYPNPFNPTTTIAYNLPEAVNVVLKIYNMLGIEVRTLLNTKQQAGHNSAVWDGKNELGMRVNSGVFVYRLQAGDIVQTKKMVLLK